jgi:hypothetical protein
MLDIQARVCRRYPESRPLAACSIDGLALQTPLRVWQQKGHMGRLADDQQGPSDFLNAIWRPSVPKGTIGRVRARLGFASMKRITGCSWARALEAKANPIRGSVEWRVRFS